MIVEARFPLLPIVLPLIPALLPPLPSHHLPPVDPSSLSPFTLSSTLPHFLLTLSCPLALSLLYPSNPAKGLGKRCKLPALKI